MKPAEKAAEPPSCLEPPIFIIGRDSKGNWVALEKNGARGGLFVDRMGALKFAKFEGGQHPHAVAWANGVLELNTSARSANTSGRRLVDGLQDVRRVA
jgi:hypothetical protein